MTSNYAPRTVRRSVKLAAIAFFLVMASPAMAADPALKNSLDALAGDGDSLSNTLQILLLMTVLTVLPSMVLMMTSFTRIIIVLSILRQALGLQQTPPNQVLVGLSLFLSMFIMQPVLSDINTRALTPYSAEQIELADALTIAGEELHEFMLKNTRKSDIVMFTEMSKTPKVQSPKDLQFSILIPAYVTSELKTAFQIGFMIFLPFLIIDLVVASALMSLGMMMLSPTIISMPFKLLLFVLVDGWALTMGSLAASFVA